MTPRARALLTAGLLSGLTALPLVAAADVPPSPKPAPDATPATPRPAAKKAPSPRPAAASPTPAPKATASPHTYTNQDLPPEEPPKEGEKGKAGEKGTPSARPPAPVPTPDTSTVDAERQRRLDEEALWRERANSARAAMTEAEAAIPPLEAQAAALANRIRLSTDTNEILRLRAELQKAQEAVDGARAQVERAKKALEDLQEEARRAGVPPGWIREP